MLPEFLSLALNFSEPLDSQEKVQRFFELTP